MFRDYDVKTIVLLVAGIGFIGVSGKLYMSGRSRVGPVYSKTAALVMGFSLIVVACGDASSQYGLMTFVFACITYLSGVLMNTFYRKDYISKHCSPARLAGSRSDKSTDPE